MQKLIPLVALIILAACNPFKVTDPADPRFDPMQFKFEDYPDIKDMIETVRMIIPLGMAKQEVDKILVESGGAKVVPHPEEKNKFVYRYKPLQLSRLVVDFMWVLQIYYDNEMHIERIAVNGRNIHPLPKEMFEPIKLQNLPNKQEESKSSK